MADDKYIETFSDIMQWKVDEWVGRCYAQSVGELYPIPDTSPNYKENGYYYKYAEQKRDMPGGVLTLDDTILAFSDRMQQLSDMSYFAPDLTTNILTYDQLSDDGKAIIPGPVDDAIEEDPVTEITNEDDELMSADAGEQASPPSGEAPSAPEPEQPAEPSAPAEPTNTNTQGGW